MTRLSFRRAFLAAFLAGLVALVLAAGVSLSGVLGWGAVVGFVVVFGIGLAVPLALAETRRQGWSVVATLAMLGELFVAAAVLDANTHLEMEGLATLLAVLVSPILLLVATGVYLVVRRRREDSPRPRRPILVAAGLPWLIAAAAVVVPPSFEYGIGGFVRAVSGFAGPFGPAIPIPNPLLVVLAMLGGAYVYGVHRTTRSVPQG